MRGELGESGARLGRDLWGVMAVRALMNVDVCLYEVYFVSFFRAGWFGSTTV